MMSQDSKISRRKFVISSGAAGTVAIAGCSGDGGSGDGGSEATETETEMSGGDDGSEMTETDTPTESGMSMDTSVLTGDGSSTVFPITNTASSYWNSNPEAGDEDYWPENIAQGEYDTEMRLADYFASQYGYEPTGTRSQPPFRTSIALSHSGTGIEGVMEERIDLGCSSAPAEAELAGSDPSEETLNNFVDHVVGIDSQPIVVSREIYDAGVTGITADQLRAIYRQEITNWSELGGPDRDILALGRAEGSGTDTAFRLNVFGDANAPIEPDQRYGQNQQLRQAMAQADNAISYIALAFVEPEGDVPPIDLTIEGTTYSYGDNLGAAGYPLARDLHAYTWEETTRREAAFINFILSDFGQERFVAGSNYSALAGSKLEEERQKVAPSNYET